MSGARPRIAVLGTGGTIAGAGRHGYDWVDYADSGIMNGIGSVLAQLPLGLPDVELAAENFRTLPSTNVTAEDWLALADAVDRRLSDDPGLAGIVITHGTSSLEETAFFLHLVHRHPAPVVLVGAQRPPNTIGSDAPANLRGAIAAGLCPILRGLGALVVMDGYVHTAAEVTKISNHGLAAFASPEFGPLARIEPDASVSVARIPAVRRQVFPLPNSAPRVDIAFSYAGADGVAIDAFAKAGAKGIVLAGFAPGRSTAAERDAAARAVASGIAVVQSSRASLGKLPLQRYNEEAGILSGGRLSPVKARILLLLALAAGMPMAEIQTWLLAW